MTTLGFLDAERFCTHAFWIPTITRSIHAVVSGISLVIKLMSPNKEKLALFIDDANLYATAKSLGFDIEYKRLLREFQSRGIC